MKRKISGNELRDRLLSRMKLLQDSEPTEKARIEALSSSGNRDLLEIIVTKQPRSVSELATLAGRLQPNVSRSLNALIRSGLLTSTLDGRVSIPTLTVEGQRKAKELGFVAQPVASADKSSPIAAETPLLSAAIVDTAEGDLSTGEVQANVTLRQPSSEELKALTAHALLDLNELCTRLLSNWWRILYRRADPFKMFPIQREIGEATSHGILLAESTGQIELFVRPESANQQQWDFPSHRLSVDDFWALIFDGLVRRLVLHLRAKKRFDDPVESLLRRTEEIRDEPADLAFWRGAGAFGFSYESIDDAAANEVRMLIEAISDEDARLELASTISHDELRKSLSWVADEVRGKAKTNSLARLPELRRAATAHSDLEPWRIGTNRAGVLREQIGLEEDRSIGGLKGLVRSLGGDSQFASSSAGEELLRGFQTRGDEIPIIIAKEEGPNSTAFLVSRAIGDYLVHGSREAPIANIYSNRQAIGRAFAAEFMAPAQGVIHMIDEENVPLATVAEHYGVGREVVRHQYENNIAQYARAV
jgi:DNA-binding MarR family transcriptional regulator